MNRSILIVICDFLLVSLVAFTTVDVNKLSDQGPRALKLEMATNRVDSAKDLTAVMQMALADERQNRERLAGELATTRDSLTRQQALLGERDKQVKGVQQELADLEKRLEASQEELAARDQRLVASQQELAERDKKVQAYQAELTARQQLGAQLAQQQAALQAQLAAAQASLTNLGQQLHDSTVQSVISGERLTAFEDLLSKQATLQSSNILQQLAVLAKTNDTVLAERVRLGTQLAAAETEKRIAAEQVSRMQDEVKIEREEKARLAEGVKELAAKSGDVAREIRDNRSLAPNSIFSEVVTNRVQARFSAVRSLLFGQTTKNRETETVLVSDGSRVHALCHVHDTPLTLWEPGTDWERLNGTLNRGAASLLDSLRLFLPFRPARAPHSRRRRRRRPPGVQGLSRVHRALQVSGRRAGGHARRLLRRLPVPDRFSHPRLREAGPELSQGLDWQIQPLAGRPGVQQDRRDPSASWPTAPIASCCAISPSRPPSNSATTSGPNTPALPSPLSIPAC